jgi:predicted dehydrogenase
MPNHTGLEPKRLDTYRADPGRFTVAAVGLDHGHIYGMCAGLEEAGAVIGGVYDPDPHKTDAFRTRFPEARVYGSEREALEDGTINMIASAAVPAERGALGLRVHRAGKHYFCDKPPFTTLQQLQEARRSVSETGLKWAVFYSERIENEAAVFAGELIRAGEIGRVIHVLGLGPHRLNAPERPDWFFRKDRYGGILTDLGSHQVEQFLFYAGLGTHGPGTPGLDTHDVDTPGAGTAGVGEVRVSSARVGNLAHPDYPGLEDYGDATLSASGGVTGYFRVDWFTPEGLSSWGDARTFIVGTEGTIELRKNLDLASSHEPSHCYLVTATGERHYALSGSVGLPFFGELIRDCLEGTEEAMPQEHSFRAAELALTAETRAETLVS